jgi:Fe-S cluster assembly iron-binding protein IscA
VRFDIERLVSLVSNSVTNLLGFFMGRGGELGLSCKVEFTAGSATRDQALEFDPVRIAVAHNQSTVEYGAGITVDAPNASKMSLIKTSAICGNRRIKVTR